MKAKNKTVTKYWLEFYINKNLCGLCGNSGKINTIGIKSAAGVSCGGIHYCICPNGQAEREFSTKIA